MVWRGSALVVTEGRLGQAHMRQKDKEDWSAWGQEVAAFRLLHPVDCEGNRNGDGKGGGPGCGGVDCGVEGDSEYCEVRA